jgi:hypothetical protein
MSAAWRLHDDARACMLLASGGASGGHWWEHGVEGARVVVSHSLGERACRHDVPVRGTLNGRAHGTLDHAQARQPLLLAGARSWFALRRASPGPAGASALPGSPARSGGAGDRDAAGSPGFPGGRAGHVRDPAAAGTWRTSALLRVSRRAGPGSSRLALRSCDGRRSRPGSRSGAPGRLRATGSGKSVSPCPLHRENASGSVGPGCKAGAVLADDDAPFAAPGLPALLPRRRRPPAARRAGGCGASPATRR